MCLSRKTEQKLTRSFNFTFRDIDNVILLNNSKIDDKGDCTYLAELELKATTYASKSASYIDLHLAIDIIKNEYIDCSVRLYLQLFIWGVTLYLLYFLLLDSGVQHILCCVFVLFFIVLCTLCCQSLWIANFRLPLRYSLTFIYIWEQLFVYSAILLWNKVRKIWVPIMNSNVYSPDDGVEELHLQLSSVRQKATPLRPPS